MKNNQISKKVGIILYIALLLFVLFNLSNSFKQFYGMKLDGDILESTLLLSGVQKTMDDPIGIKTIINNDKHPIPNRFFSHYSLHKTFRELPLFLQNLCTPIDSVYYTSAIARLVMLIMILLLLATIITGRTNLFSLKFIVVVALLIPFLPTNGGHLSREMGLIDRSVSYCFFYAMPLIFLLLYYVPIFWNLLHDRIIKMNWAFILLWAIFAIISCFSGPLNSPIILITNLILFVYLFIKNWRTIENQSFSRKCVQTFKAIPKRMYLFLFPIVFLALYSTFLGTFNNAYLEAQLSLKEMYAILPKGIWKFFFVSVSYLIMIFLLLINYLIIRLKYKNEPQSKKIFGLYQFLIFFTVLYVLLLPLGGYRPYRPFILRSDTALPITVLSMITIFYTFLFLLKQLKLEKWKYYLKTVYPSVFFLISLFFLLKNKTYVYNECEKGGLFTIASSEEETVALDNDCSVVSWGTIYDPEESRPYGELLYLWNITDKPKLYYSLPESDEK